MKRVEIVSAARVKDPALVAMCEDYEGRCRRFMSITRRTMKSTHDLDAALIPDNRRWIVALDERGVQFESRQFAKELSGWLSQPLSSVTFVIGEADGLTEAMRQRANVLLSLGKMTFAHQLVPVILTEQLYRAVSIWEGAPYHRG